LPLPPFQRISRDGEWVQDSCGESDNRLSQRPWPKKNQPNQCRGQTIMNLTNKDIMGCARVLEEIKARAKNVLEKEAVAIVEEKMAELIPLARVEPIAKKKLFRLF